MPNTQLLELFKKPLTEVFKKHFPNSRFCINIAPLGSVYVAMTLGKDKSEYINGIEHNDPCRCVGLLSLDESGFELDFKPFIGNLKPRDSYSAQHNEKIRCRIIKGNPDAIIRGFEKTLIKLSLRIKELAQEDEFLPLMFNPLDKIA